MRNACALCDEVCARVLGLVFERNVRNRCREQWFEVRASALTRRCICPHVALCALVLLLASLLAALCCVQLGSSGEGAALLRCCGPHGDASARGAHPTPMRCAVLHGNRGTIDRSCDSYSAPPHARTRLVTRRHSVRPIPPAPPSSPCPPPGCARKRHDSTQQRDIAPRASAT